MSPMEAYCLHPSRLQFADDCGHHLGLNVVDGYAGAF